MLDPEARASDGGVRVVTVMPLPSLARLAAEPAFRPQYCEVVDAETLRPVDQVTPGRTVLAVAGHLGATRLIDNADLG